MNKYFCFMKIKFTNNYIVKKIIIIIVRIMPLIIYISFT